MKTECRTVIQVVEDGSAYVHPVVVRDRYWYCPKCCAIHVPGEAVGEDHYKAMVMFDREKEPSGTVLEEAARAVDSNREPRYGHPLDNFTIIVDLVNVLFKHKIAVPFTAEDWPMIMECVELARGVRCLERDRMVDGAGYWRTLEKVIEERRRRVV